MAIGTFDLSTLNGQNGFVINGVTAGDLSGISVSSTGDLNNDGIPDILIGANYASPDEIIQAGTSYVIFGKRGPWGASTFDLSALNGTNGFVIPGLVGCINYIGEESGSSVSSVGDINNDGVADILIGAPLSGCLLESGTVYVMFGSASIGNTATFDLSTLNGNNGFMIHGIVSVGGLGYALNSAEDINGDGVVDIIIGAPGGYSLPGESYVIFGKTGIGNTGTFDLTTLNGTNGFVISDVNNGDHSGYSVNTAGDVNSDGISDILVGAYGASPAGKTLAGAAYVIFGKLGSRSSGTFNLSSLNGTNGFAIPGLTTTDRLGWSASGAGDVNNDGIDDFLVGSTDAGPNGKFHAGTTYVIFGKVGIGGSGIFDLSTLNGTNGFLIPGVNAYDQVGYVVSKAGDVNGDGIADILIGAPGASAGLNNGAGTSYVIFGKSGIGSSGIFDLNTLNGTNGFAMPGLAIDDQMGTAISSGDINKDGITDVIIGSPYAAALGQAAAGKTYVVFGSNRVPQLLINQLSLNQGGISTLTATDLSATDPVYNNDELSFNPVDVNHGYFQFVGNPGVPVTNISQLLVDAGQIQFVHDGSANAPSYSISVSNLSPIPSYPQAASIAFNYAPVIVNNNLTIFRGETVLLTMQDLSATDRNDIAADLIFSLSNVQYGQFSFVSQPGASIYSFIQNEITSQQVQFTQDGSLNTPSYAVSVSDGRVSDVSGPQAAMIHFNAGNPILITNNSSNSTPAIVGGIVGASIGVIALLSLSAIYARNKAKQTLEQAIESQGADGAFRRSTFSPIVKEVYRQIKISGCLGQIDIKTAERFVRAIQTVIEKLQQQGVNLDLDRMVPEDRQRLFREIVDHICFYAIPRSSLRCPRFFKAEVTPNQIEDKAHAIARGVADVMNQNPAGVEMHADIPAMN